ncbi:Uncharacterized protein QTN25_001444 [Entamoeba marina]
MNDDHHINNLLQNLFQQLQMTDEIRVIITSIFTSISNPLNMINNVTNVPIDYLLSIANSFHQLLFSPLYQHLLPLLNSSQPTHHPQNILSYLHRTDLLQNDIPPPPQYSSTHPIHTLLDNTHKILLPCPVDIRDEVILVLSRRQAALALGRGLFFYGTYESAKIQEVVLDGVCDGLPVSFTPSLHLREIVLPYYQKRVDGDPASVGIFFGKAIRGGLNITKSETIFNALAVQDVRYDAAVFLSLSLAHRKTCDPTVIRTTKIALQNRLDAPSMLTQSYALISLSLVCQSSSRREELTLLMQHLTTPPPTSELSLHHIWAAGYGIGTICFKQRLSHDIFQTMYIKKTQETSLKFSNCNLVITNQKIPKIVGVQAASLAFALAYFDTCDTNVCNILSPPLSHQIISQMRPDDTFIRSLASQLVCYKFIEPTNSYITNQIPAFLRNTKFDDLSLINTKYAFVTAACFSIGLKYAGTLQQSYCDLLLEFLQKIRLSFDSASKSDDWAVLANLVHFDRFLKIIGLSATLIMAGSGYPELRKELEIMHQSYDESISYGSYEMVSLSLGLLHCGEEQYSVLGNVDNIPLLIAACYPLFEAGIEDNVIYPKLLRYLIIGCLQKRMCYSFNCSINEYEKVPVLVGLNENGASLYGKRELSITLPNLLPPLEFVNCLQTTNNYLYHSVGLDDLLKSNVFCVKNKQIIDKYDDDVFITNDVDVKKVFNYYNNALFWMTTTVRNQNRSLLDSIILELLIYAFSLSSNMKSKIIAESCRDILTL